MFFFFEVHDCLEQSALSVCQSSSFVFLFAFWLGICGGDVEQTLLEVIHRSEEGPTREDEMKLISLKAENEKMAEKLLEMEVIRVEEYSVRQLWCCSCGRKGVLRFPALMLCCGEYQTVYDEYVGVREGIKDQLVQTFRQGCAVMQMEESLCTHYLCHL